MENSRFKFQSRRSLLFIPFVIRVLIGSQGLPPLTRTSQTTKEEGGEGAVGFVTCGGPDIAAPEGYDCGKAELRQGGEQT